jgi:hypothetical protein
MSDFNGLGVSLHNVWRHSGAKSRSISAENFTGAKGEAARATDGTGKNAARELGQGWKVSPSIHIPARTVVTLAEIDGPGAIQHFWNTVHPSWWRRLVLRLYWDGEETPSVETPLGDLFCNGWCQRCNVNSLPIVVNPAGGFNSYWEMPFRKDHSGEPGGGGVSRLLLSGGLRADGGTARRHVSACSVAQKQPASL